ncbi:hypothetical protein [Lutibaculum baratangense]|nr:hypothetical protein [Lutibaculum baratangense]
MTVAPAPVPYVLRLLPTLLLLLAWMTVSSPCGAQDQQSAGAGDADPAQTASVFLPRPEVGMAAGRAATADITAFTSREVLFGLFVLIVGFAALLVLLPSGIKPHRGGRRGQRDLFR